MNNKTAKSKKIKNKQPKKPPLLRDKESMKEIVADSKQVQHFFENLIKKSKENKDKKYDLYYVRGSK